MDSGAILVIEWSENIEAALPENTTRVRIEQLTINQRRIELYKPV
jgi:tRNA A37 threonylcarbamoyladenosine biosynthesis protein TsaE